MAMWVVAALLVPFSLNQLDKAAGKIMTLADAIKRKRKRKRRGW